MNAFPNVIDAWILALLLAGAMLAAWWIGWWRGRHLPPGMRPEPASKLNDASLAMLGLLLAFTFSMALSRHEHRREMVVNDSNAIGDFYTAASCTAEPVRGQLRAVIRQYTGQGLALAKERLDEATFQTRLGELQEMHGKMQTLVERAVAEKTYVVVPLVNTLNGLTSSYAARLSAFRDRLPPSVVALLFLATVVSMVFIGQQEGATGEHHFGTVIGFVVLVSLAVWVTLDLNQPQQGLITVSQEPMERLLSGMGP
jgi:MFS family permease